ncbi:Multi antimicrobial extrusion protein [Penicillium robsamsonii]|uniref:Multi antimicrobial extrusion protein n=1 Tax=Penicillium robsamsonii TaxID=1792511 RepID=UPI002548F21F|nr:Multi antimicrobial extrusion protein [Penicillium robsamsonii]KAJ5813174.1 Multi antimicrobial extrusion protein [Penicillium robsamsonii]
MGPRNIRSVDSAEHQSPFSRSFTSSSPIAASAIARDLADYNDEDRTPTDEASDTSTARPPGSYNSTNPRSLADSYRRPGYFTSVSHATVVPWVGEQQALSQSEREQVIEEERDLLSDNHVIAPEHAYGKTHGLQRKMSGLLSAAIGQGISSRRPSASSRRSRSRDPETDAASEITALLGERSADAEGSELGLEEIDRRWGEAVAAGLIQTTWQREAKVIIKYSLPLMVTFLLQYSLTVASIFTIGHLGKEELGAVSLASMTVTITGNAVYSGLATSLDTLCAQAYGSGKRKLVGLQMLRMVYFLWVITIPIMLLWYFSEHILVKIIPEKEVAEMAGLYLKIALLGTPGFALFESGKRYLQAQGVFSASLYVLIVCAPLNAFMNWFFVWKLQWGFIGAPIAVVITENLLPLGLFIYVYFFVGSECWCGFTKRAFQNWGPMIRLALPGLIMVEAECLAFEILTLCSSYLGTSALAAQSILATIASITWQIPFPLSIAGSTRIANLIGATLVDAAKISAKVSLCGAAIVGVFNMVLLSFLRSYIPRLFSSDPEVVEIVAQVLPLCAAFQLFDALAANCNGILRGLGRQEVGGYIQLFCYYAIAMPLSMGTTFALNWGVMGLWTGVALALSLVSLIEGIFISRANWDRSVEDALARNEQT